MGGGHLGTVRVGEGVEDMVSEEYVSHGLQEIAGPHTVAVFPSLGTIKTPPHTAVISPQIKPLGRL